MTSERTRLLELAGLHSIQPWYQDAAGRHVIASTESIMAALDALGAGMRGAADSEPALRARRAELAGELLEPVTVVWEHQPAVVTPRLRAEELERPIEGTLLLEDGGTRELSWDPDGSAGTGRIETDGQSLATLALPDNLPLGYHRLEISTRERSATTLLLVAPNRAYLPHDWNEGRRWGVFLPLYALHTSRSWGAGDYSDLHAAARWVRRANGHAVGTLPLLPTFLDEPFEPSPYAPVSRLFWNEAYVDPREAPGAGGCPEFNAVVHSEAFQDGLAALRESEVVDHRSLLRHKLAAMAPLAERAFADPILSADIQEFESKNPEVASYAAFRAACDRTRAGWRGWPEHMRSRGLQPGDYDPARARLYLYAQWLASRQVEQIQAPPASDSADLYLDLPLGAHPSGFDVWSRQEQFAVTASVGAPPDPLATEGQDWGFPPLRPESSRQDGHRYYRDCLRHHMRAASVLRLDHVMGMHRLFWIPEGVGARNGVYVRYPQEELYAILALESRRSQTAVIGEDLGTVPPYVRDEMDRHDVQRMYAWYFHIRPGAPEPVETPSEDTVASVNTHDLPPFRAFWEGTDIDDRLSLGWLSDEEAAKAREERAEQKRAVLGFLGQQGLLPGATEHAEPEDTLAAVLRFLGASPSPFVVVNVEDLWQEPLPQNVPGTSDERPNWRRRARHSLEDWDHIPSAQQALEALRVARSS